MRSEREQRRQDEQQAAQRVGATPAHPFSGLGNAAVARAMLARNPATFTPQGYEEAMAKKAEFMDILYRRRDYRPSTGRGNFDVTYDAKGGRLVVTVRCHFNFLGGSESDYPDADPEELAWDPKASAEWKTKFMELVSAKWSNTFTFHCTKPWWEDLKANVQIRFVEDSKDPHYDLNITKIPEDEERGSSVTAPKWWQDKGKTKFDSEDLRPHDKAAGTQRPAVHEAGHMLGLADEYPIKKGKKAKTAAHDLLVRTEFGHGVARKRDGRVMSNGEDIEPEHGVTFIEALRVVTMMKEWSFDAKPPTPVPTELIDGPLPKPKQDPLAPEGPEVAFA
ncbi:hypothetical protein [Solirubrobacter phytolaccae]|nr:hypothetical protein [Solirubrobacter phytolaccae]